MDPAALASAVVILLIPLLRRVGERAVDRLTDDAGEIAVSKLKQLYGVVRTRLSDDTYTATLLNGVEVAPEDTMRQRNLQAALTAAISDDSDFAANLQRLVEEIRSAQATSEGIHVTTVVGRDNIKQEGLIVAGRDVRIKRSFLSWLHWRSRHE